MLLPAAALTADTLTCKVEKRLAGQGYFWFRDDFDGFCLCSLESEVPPGAEGCGTGGGHIPSLHP